MGWRKKVAAVLMLFVLALPACGGEAEEGDEDTTEESD